jgi:class 3 adenylate cyclase/pimeloyl-ACP methyl ester carboxylesterase
MAPPETRYAKSGDVYVAYQVVGGGPPDLVFVPPHASNVDTIWEVAPRAEANRRLAEFTRLVLFDKRGTGLSDRIGHVATLEERMDDVRAVLDAVGSPRAALLGIGDGAAMALLFAATYPERCLALVLYAAQARWTWAPDYPWAPTRETLERQIAELPDAWATRESARRSVAYLWPDREDDEALIAAMQRLSRHSMSPSGAAALERMNLEIDVRGVLPSVHVPTLIFTRDDNEANPHARYLAEHIRTAQLHKLIREGGGIFDGRDPSVYAAIQEFLTNAELSSHEPIADRVLATVLFTDIVDSTAKAVEVGDRGWATLVAEHHARVRRELIRHRGLELDTAGDGFFASFDGPARAILCACAIRESVRDLGVEIRAGLHTGECERVDGKIAGVAVVTGARIASLAASGEVLVSATVRDLVAGSGITLVDRGLHTLKGLPEQRRLFAVA